MGNRRAWGIVFQFEPFEPGADRSSVFPWQRIVFPVREDEEYHAYDDRTLSEQFIGNLFGKVDERRGGLEQPGRSGRDACRRSDTACNGVGSDHEEDERR